MSRSDDEEKNQRQLGRRKFLRIGTLGAAGLAAVKVDGNQIRGRRLRRIANQRLELRALHALDYTSGPIASSRSRS